MAKTELFVSCTNPHISEGELMNSLIAKDAEGTVGIRTKIIDIAAEDLEDYLSCGNPPIKSMLDFMKATIGLDSEGKACLVLFNVA